MTFQKAHISLEQLFEVDSTPAAEPDPSNLHLDYKLSAIEKITPKVSSGISSNFNFLNFLILTCSGEKATEDDKKRQTI